jgi:hypothetical protein
MTVAEFAGTVKLSKQIDPITISIIISIVLFVLQNCVLNRRVLVNPSMLQKWRLRQICYKADRDNWRELYGELLIRAKSVSDGQLEALKEDSLNYGRVTL